MEIATLLAWLPAGFVQGIAIGAVLLCIGAVVGAWIGRRHSANGTQNQARSAEMVGQLTHLVQWSRGLAEEMSQYSEVVTGVSRLFSTADQPLDSKERSVSVDLLAQVVDANERLKRRLGHAEVMLKRQTDEIAAHMSDARTDPLTKLPNRRAFDEGLTRYVAEWHRHGSSLSILTFDVDHFKRVNDSYGHQVGDEVLLGVAERLKKTMRESDLVTRIGGEELAVVLPSSDIEEACQAAERARKAIEQLRFSSEGLEFQVTVSVGVAQCLRNESGPEMVNRADEALYAAKGAGRNCSYWHDGERCVSNGATSDGSAGDQAALVSERSSEPEFSQICDDLRRRLNEVVAERAVRD